MVKPFCLLKATRRLAVDTRALKALGVIAAKDATTLEQYYKLRNQSEKKVYESRDPGAEVRSRAEEVNRKERT